jgi:hypothetical protein
VWAGYTFDFGEKAAFAITPMLARVFGTTAGFAPGYRGTLDWRRLELSTEGEYVFDTGDRSGSFFYSWSELSVSPLDWLRTGLAVQRTRRFESPREIQRGVLAGIRFDNVEMVLYVFNPDDGKPLAVLSAAIKF